MCAVPSKSKLEKWKRRVPNGFSGLSILYLCALHAEVVSSFTKQLAEKRMARQPERESVSRSCLGQQIEAGNWTAERMVETKF